MDFKEELIESLSNPNSGLKNPVFKLRDSPSGKVSGFIVSPSFEGLSQMDRQDKIWKYLDAKFEKERLLDIVLLFTVTPEEDERD